MMGWCHAAQYKTLLLLLPPWSWLFSYHILKHCIPLIVQLFSITCHRFSPSRVTFVPHLLWCSTFVLEHQQIKLVPVIRYIVVAVNQPHQPLFWNNYSKILLTTILKIIVALLHKLTKTINPDFIFKKTELASSRILLY